MTAPLVFMDTETTGLALDDDIWEFAAIRREADGTEREVHLLIEHNRARCGRLPEPFRSQHCDRYLDHRAITRRAACDALSDLFSEGKPYIVGAVPNFDTERLTRMLSAERPYWELDGWWHHRLKCVETLAEGHLRRRIPGGLIGCAEALGIDYPANEQHTAMGDVKAARAIYDAVMGGAA